MTLYNADGSPAEMSGNGIRCLAWVAVDRGLGDRRLVVDTAAGRRTIDLDRDAPPASSGGHGRHGRRHLRPGR